MNRYGVAAVALMLTLGGSTGAACSVQAHAAKSPAVVVRSGPGPTSPGACDKGAPRSAAGMTALFHTLPADQYIGSDVGISHPVKGGVVWLGGDTTSTGRFVHSSALIQNAGCIHASYKGAQLLPDENPTLIYWVDSAFVMGNYLMVRAAQVQIGSKSAWDFKATGVFRIARTHITIHGNLHFDGWAWRENDASFTHYDLTKTIMQCSLHINGHVVPDSPPASELCPTSPKGEFSYFPQVHREIHLSTGKTLVTVAFNGPFYGLKFYEVAGV